MKMMFGRLVAGVSADAVETSDGSHSTEANRGEIMLRASGSVSFILRSNSTTYYSPRNRQHLFSKTDNCIAAILYLYVRTVD